jgi:integrase
MGYDNETMTPHGFRAMASSLLNRVLDKEGRRRWDRDLIEQQLAHVDGTVRGHYNRADTTDALQQRRAMLQAWANYLDDLKAYPSNVVSFKR